MLGEFPTQLRLMEAGFASCYTIDAEKCQPPLWLEPKYALSCYEWVTSTWAREWRGGRLWGTVRQDRQNHDQVWAAAEVRQESTAKAEASGSLASVSSTASSHKFYKLVSDDVKGDPKCGLHQGFPDGSVVENPPANAGDLGSIPEWGRSPGGGHDYPLQYSCLGNPMDRGAWWATVHRVAKELGTT